MSTLIPWDEKRVSTNETQCLGPTIFAEIFVGEIMPFRSVKPLIRSLSAVLSSVSQLELTTSAAPVFEFRLKRQIKVQFSGISILATMGSGNCFGSLNPSLKS